MLKTVSREIRVSPEYTQLLPKLTPEEYSELKKSIQKEGLYYPIIINDKGIILDGYHRRKACKEIDITPRYETKTFPDKLAEKEFVLDSNVKRRQLTVWQRCELAEKYEEIEKERAKQRLSVAGKIGAEITNYGVVTNDNYLDIDETGRALEKAAKKANVGYHTVRKYKYIKEVAPQLIPKIKQQKKSINAFYKNLKHKEKIEKLKQEIPKLTVPEGRFEVIVVDPPWNYESKYDADGHRVSCPYPEQTLEEIQKEPIPEKAAKNCVLWLWTTNAFMHQAYHILEAWGFTPKTILTWVKNKFGVGSWLRGQTEHCILAIKGNPVINLTNQSTVLFAAVTKHSKKPDKFYEMVNQLCIGRKLDFYGRKNRKGWIVYGTKE